jgi:hypothetical protein
VGQPEDELARQLRFSLIQEVYVERWKTPEVCEVVFSENKWSGVERDCAPQKKAIKGSSNI